MDDAGLETERRGLEAQLEEIRARGFESHQDLLDYGDLLGRLLQIETRLERSARGPEGPQQQ